MRKEHPILFSTPMVQAILAGKKTQTRRIHKHPPAIDEQTGDWLTPISGEVMPLEEWINVQPKFCKYKVDDVLWVRETWANLNTDFKNVEPYIVYKADLVPDNDYGPVTWKPSIHMEKKYCRIWLQITNIKVERVQNISEKDVSSEGVQYPVVNTETADMVKPVFKIGEKHSAIQFMPENWRQLKQNDLSKALMFAHWAELWCSINGRESWDANQWVWVISFKKINKRAS